MDKYFTILLIFFSVFGYSQTALKYLDIALGKVESENYIESIQLFNKSISLDSSNADAYVGRGHAKQMLGDNRGALQDANKAVKIDPRSVGAYIGIAIAKQELGDYKGAMQNYNMIIELDPTNAKIYVSRGFLKMMLGNIDAGCLDLSKAGELGTERAYELIREYCN